MDWISTLLGAAIVVIGLNDVFHTLFHPSGSGRFSTHVLNALWLLSRRVQGRPGQMVGPVGIVLVIALWTLFQALGWALFVSSRRPRRLHVLARHCTGPLQ